MSDSDPSDTSTIPAHGATIGITPDGVTVRRGPMAQNLLPAELSFSPDRLRGWYHQAPTESSPGWLQFSLSEAPDGSVERPVRGFPATRGAANIVTFAPGQADEFAAAEHLLVNLQAGYPLDEAEAEVEAAKEPPAEAEQDTLFPVEIEEPTDSRKDDSGASSAKRGNWRAVATPDTIPETNTDADANNPVFGQNVTVTGDFAPYEKGEVWDMIAGAGGTVGKNVTKKTTLLVIGEWNSVTSKEKRARELKEKGQEITLWTFDEFLDALGRSRRPDLEEIKGTSAPF